MDVEEGLPQHQHCNKQVCRKLNRAILDEIASSACMVQHTRVVTRKGGLVHGATKNPGILGPASSRLNAISIRLVDSGLIPGQCPAQLYLLAVAAEVGHE